MHGFNTGTGAHFSARRGSIERVTELAPMETLQIFGLKKGAEKPAV